MYFVGLFIGNNGDRLNGFYECMDIYVEIFI